MEGEAASANLHSEIIGVLYVDSRSSSHRCTSNVTQALASLVNQAAMVIENARLQRIMHEKRALEKELALAHQIQQQLLPKELPQSTNLDVASINIPCRNVGGDYFDYMLFEDGRTGVVIGDVSGKGIPAALLMSTLQGIFYAQAFSSQGTAETVTKVNRYLVARSLENSYLTAFYCVISPLGQLMYTNAGHNPPLLLRASGEVVPLAPCGPALGIASGARWSDADARFEPGDTLAIYTDGIVEARDATRRFFGVDRLVAAVRRPARSARDVRQNVLRDLAAHTGGGTPHDDMTLLIVRGVALAEAT